MAQEFKFEITLSKNGGRAPLRIMIGRGRHQMIARCVATRTAGERWIESAVGAFNLTKMEVQTIMDELYRLVPAARPTT